MAVLNHKILGDIEAWRRLPQSAKNLIGNGLRNATDENGYGTKSIYTLMKWSGMNSKGTFYFARNKLVEANFLRIKKTWEFPYINGKPVPRARIYYQISENVLWKKHGNTNDIKLNTQVIQSPVYESPVKRKDKVINNKVLEVINNTRQASNNNSFKGKGFQSIGQALANDDDFLNQLGKPSEHLYEWQEHAAQIGEKLKVDYIGNKRWFGFFKKSHLNEHKGLLEAALRYCIDYIGTKDPERLFYSQYWRLLKENQAGRELNV